MELVRAETFRFHDFTIDTRTFEVSLNGAAVALERRVYDLVIHLIRFRDRVVTKDELLENVWMQERLSESAIAQAVSKARRVFSDRSCIQTIFGRGYRWVTPVTIEPNSATTEGQAGPPTLLLTACNLGCGSPCSYFGRSTPRLERCLDGRLKNS